MDCKGKVEFLCKIVCLTLVGLLALTSVAGASTGESIQYYKMISSIEYAGQGQFSDQIERLFTVRGKALAENKVQYFISAKDLIDDLTFVVDRKAQHLSKTSSDSALWAQMNNDCVKALQKVTKANIDKTWKQKFELSVPGGPADMSFTLTAIQVKNRTLGNMIAVRALSEPFFVELPDGKATSRINTCYLFDTEIEEVYLSVSVFETTTTKNGFQETLRHEIATCKTDSAGNEVDLKGLGSSFEKFVSKLGVNKEFKIVKPVALPQWAKEEGLQAAQAGSICSSLSCEGALNPVATISLPTTRVVELQKDRNLRTVDAPLGEATTVEAAGPWEWLVAKVGFWPAAGIVGGTAVGVAAGGGGGGGGSSSP